MVAAPNIVTSRTEWRSEDAPTVVIAIPGPSLVRPMLATLLPALIVAVPVGAVAGPGPAPYLGAAIGAIGAAAGLRKAIRGW
jgi:hypothetical protein